MVTFEATFNATHMQATIALAIGDRPLTAAKIMIKANRQPTSGRRHAIGKFGRHADSAFAFTFAFAFAFPLSLPAIIIRPGAVARRVEATLEAEASA